MLLKMLIKLLILLTAFYIVLCAALIGPRRIFREILESDYRHRGQTIEAHSGSGADVVYEDRFDDVFEGFQEASAVEVVEDLPDLDADDGSRRLCGGHHLNISMCMALSAMLREER